MFFRQNYDQDNSSSIAPNHIRRNVVLAAVMICLVGAGVMFAGYGQATSDQTVPAVSGGSNQAAAPDGAINSPTSTDSKVPVEQQPARSTTKPAAASSKNPTASPTDNKPSTTSQPAVSSPVPSPPAPSPPPAPAGTLLFNANIAANGLAAYGNVIHPERIAVVNDPILGSARKVMKFTVYDTDIGPTSDPRAQVESPTQFVEGQDVYVGWSTYFPTGWPQMLPAADSWVTFSEFYGPPYNGPAPVSFGMAGSPQAGLSYLSHENNTNWQYAWNTQPIQLNRWYDFVVREHLSEDITKGFVELWMNTGSGWQQQLIHGQTRYYTKTIDIGNNGGANYHKLALYRKAGMYAEMTLYHADHKIGTTFDIVAPKSY